MRKIFNLYKCDCKIIVAEGQKTYTRTYFIIGSREEIAERKALLYMTQEFSEALEGKSYTFQPSISGFVYNCIV